MTKELHVIASIICKKGMQSQVIAAVEDCIPPSRAEDGCIMYDFYADNEVEGKFVFIETWTDKAALDHHLTLPHFLTLAEKLTPLLDQGFSVQLLEKISAD